MVREVACANISVMLFRGMLPSSSASSAGMESRAGYGSRAIALLFHRSPAISAVRWSHRDGPGGGDRCGQAGAAADDQHGNVHMCFLQFPSPFSAVLTGTAELRGE